ncbi:hypothetical protein KIN20_017853 [Parelaphostrongylus tenuis]|uniref:Uncharacterized protein n=1 Tax=Parelaphostrongylus tenuis TaxID=148309 RepID=A0AAD5N3K4_PARTN|nr:hypothetical protein KIN20_017853 [Parelaphostrongylus tenuis]
MNERIDGPASEMSTTRLLTAYVCMALLAACSIAVWVDPPVWVDPQAQEGKTYSIVPPHSEYQSISSAFKDEQHAFPDRLRLHGFISRLFICGMGRPACSDG